MKSIILKPKEGNIAFHVFTPALMYRLDKNNPIEMPVMALRLSTDNYEQMMLFDKIECLGQSSLDPLFENPLPGTNGRGVAIMFTKGRVRCHFRGRKVPVKIDCTEGRDPKAILADVIRSYRNRKPYLRKSEGVIA
jgi:hypothetical protein